MDSQQAYLYSHESSPDAQQLSPSLSLKKKGKASSLSKKKTAAAPETYYVIQNLVPSTKIWPKCTEKRHIKLEKSTLHRGPHDMIPINYEERTTQEVLTNAMIQRDSDDQKKFFMNMNLFKGCGHNDKNKIGYQYCSSYKRHFPLLYRKV